MRTLPASLAPLGTTELVMTRTAADGTVTSRLRWAAKATSHAVTCDYLVGRGFRVCSCRASRVAAAEPTGR
jgi:hypothetical protein